MSQGHSELIMLSDTSGPLVGLLLLAGEGERGGAGMSQNTHSYIAFSHGEALSCQHVCLHQILHVDPVHARPAVPKPEHEQSLLDVALAWGRDDSAGSPGWLYALYTHS